VLPNLTFELRTLRSLENEIDADFAAIIIWTGHASLFFLSNMHENYVSLY
jgi:hypothetical protein